MKKIFLYSLLLTGSAAFFPAFAQDDAQVSVTAAPDVAVVTPAPDAPLPTAPAMTATETTVPAPAQEQPLAPGMVAALPAASDASAPGMSPIEKEINEQLAYLKPNVDVNAMPSLFFSIWEHDLIVDARRGLTTRMPGSEDGLEQTGPREIVLGGIVYVSGKEWTIWLNNTRVSPTAIPDEVLDLKVFKEYIELEWFDQSTNQIFPIRLRPHQRFNLDARIFLPG